MNVRIRPSALALLVIALCAAVIGGFYIHRHFQNNTVSKLARRLPEVDSTVFYVDLAALRSSGLLDLLAGAGADEAEDYRKFVEQTGFDYRTDLDAVLASFQTADKLFVLRGRFEWRRLYRYVGDNGGDCQNGLCTMRGSEPNRWISFLPIGPRIMALAASPDRYAALALTDRGRVVEEADVPSEPVWVRLEPQSLSRSSWLPDGTQSFLTALKNSDQVTLAVGPADTDFEARLSVDCETAEEAASLAADLQRITDLLKSLIRLERKSPNPDDLSGVLVGGVFEHEGYSVIGRWPVTRGFLENVANGEASAPAAGSPDGPQQ